MREHEDMPQEVRFGIFDWLDETGRGFGESYEERLRMLEHAERCGFYAYHLAEHHGTALNTTPSPSLFLAAAAQRTRRLRLGALTWVLPLYDPLRLAEELCMLDQLSGGRLDIGVGRGSSPHEGMRHGVTREQSAEIYREALDVLIRAWKTGELNHRGEYFSYEGVKVRLRPVQRPYPPLWYPTNNPDSVAWAAAQGMNTLFSLGLLGTPDRVCQMVRAYWDARQASVGRAAGLNGHVDRPLVGFTAHTYIGESDEEAYKQAREAIFAWYENFVRRYLERGEAKYPETLDFDRLLAEGRFFVGSPATVGRQLRSMLEKSGANYVVGTFAFGNLPAEKTLKSIDLFSREVMPSLGGLQAG